MGLAERRAALHFQTDRFPALKQEIDAAAHFEVPVTVEWDKLSADGYADRYDEYWTAVYFTPLIAALRGITIDDLGTQALRDGLRGIAITNVQETSSYDRIAKFADGVLTLDHVPASNVHHVDERTKAIQQVLEMGL